MSALWRQRFWCNHPRRMKKKVLVLAMAVLFAILLIFVIVSGVQGGADLETNDLQLVHVIVRHGIRTPVDTYPYDPYLNETFFPVGWGQLTNGGKKGLYELGKFLRNRYGHFLSDTYSSDVFHAQSTDVDRTMASVQMINAGLWVPRAEQQWGSLLWQPIPVHYEPLDEDSLLLVRRPCPQYEIELDRVRKLPEIKEMLRKNDELFMYLEKHTGKSVTNFDDVQDIYTTLQAEQALNLTLPQWTIRYFPDKMNEPASFSYVLRTYNDKLKRLKGGLLLKKLIDDWESKMAGTIEPKNRRVFLYGGHDSTIANLLAALGVFDPQVPGFSVTIMLELSRDKFTKKFELKVYFRNSTVVPPYELRIPGCEKLCPFENFIELVGKVVPDDWVKECETNDPNYTHPPPNGP